MKRLALCLLLAIPPLTACASLSAPPAPIISTAGTTFDEKRLYDAERTYNIAAHAYLTAVARGQLTGNAKAAAKDGLQKALLVLKGLRQGVQTLNAADFNTQLSEAAALIASARSLTH